MANYSPRATSVDGGFGFWDKVLLQRWLQLVGCYSNARERDGVWGYWTTLGLQQYMRSKTLARRSIYGGWLDGDFGPQTKRAMAETAWYVFGGRPGSGLGSYCAGAACTTGWPNGQVVRDWQYTLNSVVIG